MNTPNATADTSRASDHWIADIAKNRRETVRVEITNYRGADLIRLWNWYNDGGELKPGRGGVSLRVDRLPQLHEAVTKALAAARDAGLVEAGDDRG